MWQEFAEHEAVRGKALAERRQLACTLHQDVGGEPARHHADHEVAVERSRPPGPAALVIALPDRAAHFVNDPPMVARQHARVRRRDVIALERQHKLASLGSKAVTSVTHNEA